MAWIMPVPPARRHPRERFQVVYRDNSGHQRSGGIYTTRQAAEGVRRRLDRGERIESIRGLPEAPVTDHKGRTLFGDYVTNTWWPRWRDGHPHSAYLYGKRIEKRILPAFGNLRFVDLDADLIGDWKAKMLAAELAPQTINAYLSLLSTIFNAAVDSDYLPRSPMRRKSQAGRAEAVKKEREPRREEWLTRAQLDRVAAAISLRYRAFDDGAVAGPGRLRVVRALSDPGNSGDIRVKGPKTEASKRTITLDQETVDAFMAHRQLVGDDVCGDGGYVFTTPGGSRGPGGPLARSNFWRVWNRALKDAKLHTLWQEHGGLHFHDLRHTHATWLLARRVPLIAVANRLGHANPVITMMIYAHVDRLVDRGELTADDLGLEGDDLPNTQK